MAESATLIIMVEKLSCELTNVGGQMIGGNAAQDDPESGPRNNQGQAAANGPFNPFAGRGVQIGGSS